jgi:tetratricopeptide (TPR) repeat protein
VNKTVLFISHTASDRSYALALKQFIEDLRLNPNPIDVKISTSADSGPEGGETWRDWIHSAVISARTTLIIVTPHALGKPWLLWEAGAVKGASLARAGASAADTSPIIVSLAFGLPVSECPDPLRGEQIIQGTDLERLRELFIRVLQNHGVSGKALFDSGTLIEQAFKRYIPAVESAMQRAPSLINEPNVQDWLKRLEALAADKRLSELAGFERWMMLAFGRDTDEDATTGGIPIDVRLHRALGELQLGQRQYANAVRQLRLAWRAAPRDIYVLRPLAEASMKYSLEIGEAGSATPLEQINTLLAAIRELDDKAFTATPEAAALLAKYHRRVLHEPDKALEIYGKALEANPDSYYLADLIAQTELDLKRIDAARAGFERALSIIERLGERNIWSLATAATACIALARPERAHEHLSALREVGPPSASQADSIAQGIREVASRVGVAADVVDKLLLDLGPQSETTR